MNSGFYKNIDENFEQACLMSEQEYSQEELLSMLQNGNIPQKQIAALKLSTIKNLNEAQILLNNLCRCDGKIREAVALKINLLMPDENIKNIFCNCDAGIFAQATIDMNGNVCRLVIDSVEKLLSDSIFKEKYSAKILETIEETFVELDKIIYKDKKYTINKQLFKLYWCLEALKLFAKIVEPNKLLQILNRSVLEKEYTIREKVAQIVNILGDEMFDKLRQKLASDENYYVRQVFKSS